MSNVVENETKQSIAPIITFKQDVIITCVHYLGPPQDLLLPRFSGPSQRFSEDFLGRERGL